MKTEIQKCLDGEIFNTSDPEIQGLIKRVRDITKEYNYLATTDTIRKEALLTKLFGSIGKNVSIDTPFYCDYGRHITIGDNVIININCTFVDCNRIYIGNNVLIASNVQIYTATHPVETSDRLIENWTEADSSPFFRTYALPVTLEDNVWIGGGVIILPGVTIGKNSVIGAGSVVTRSIPGNSVAFGNPCKVIRENNPTV
ncbi:sugar O-acetyltransferase [Pedobacter mucosus]|uniref:sugar O-acetyltransferase n=1 Tax=Pedobacter mucosus TaxID=2895286 RepID=UPI001EE3EA21|nr:sugar O-acetyltransferase [Pedobacter mucosus]UKT63039.1 sugar O-acetyltransferase [Pedobacter mucosus]